MFWLCAGRQTEYALNHTHDIVSYPSNQTICVFAQEDKWIWTAAWQTGWPAPTIGGHTAGTDFQALESFHSHLKKTLPVGYHRMDLQAVTNRIQAGMRSPFKERKWTSSTEEVVDDLTLKGVPWPGGVNSQTVCRRMLSGDWISGERQDCEARYGWASSSLSCVFSKTARHSMYRVFHLCMSYIHSNQSRIYLFI